MPTARSLRTSVLAPAALVYYSSSDLLAASGLVLKKGKKISQQTTTSKRQDEWALECDSMHGLVTPYYVPNKDFPTKVGCVPLMCENKLGKSDDVAVGTAAPCTWEGGADSCCTDKIKDPCAGGKLPCILGEVTSLTDYTAKAVHESNSTNVEAIKGDCGTNTKDFEESAKEATTVTAGADATAGSAPAPPGDPFVLLGCFQDKRQRAMGKMAKGAYSVAECAEHCAGYEFFAIQSYQQCFCSNGNDHEKYGKTPDGDCSTPCKKDPAADGERQCGGGWRNSVYKVPAV
ncbi:unnamed protein product [Amoebophrya sp. A120]|nr:unnamed protein product [Amoebophrya sp. A120]|eukprot:GSA120T00013908001.1